MIERFIYELVKNILLVWALIFGIVMMNSPVNGFADIFSRGGYWERNQHTNKYDIYIPASCAAHHAAAQRNKI